MNNTANLCYVCGKHDEVMYHIDEGWTCREHVYDYQAQRIAALESDLAAACRRLVEMERERDGWKKIADGWSEAADAGEQAPDFYSGYDATVMRAMQALLSDANKDRKELRKTLGGVREERDTFRDQLASISDCVITRAREILSPFLPDITDIRGAINILADCIVELRQENILVCTERDELKTSLGSRLAAARAVVDEQAKDDGLWFAARTAPEGYLQAALRRLHRVVEGDR